MKPSRKFQWPALLLAVLVMIFYLLNRAAIYFNELFESDDEDGIF